MLSRRQDWIGSDLGRSRAETKSAFYHPPLCLKKGWVYPLLSITLKVAVNTIVPRSPFFFVFVPQNPDCYTHQKKRGRISPSMKWRYLCYFQLVAKAKHSLTPKVNKKVCPRDEIADPPGMAVLPVDIYGFDEGLVSFRTLCGVQSSLVRFAPNQAIDWGPLQWQAWLETLCLSSAFS